MTSPQVAVSELEKEDLQFLFDLWRIPEVMRYADELPRLRGWSRSDDLETAWQIYRHRRVELGPGYAQLILRLKDGTAIGESFFAPLPEGYTFGKWEKPEGVESAIGDIKLRPEYWGRGLGTEAMRRVVEWIFTHTRSQLLIVPPHRKNPAASRVYEKAGFELFTGMRSWHNHQVMELRRERYEMIHGA
ncbi:MAG: GNAT family N-acetyltransferase [Anaerolineae bacterium]|jgi:RimJ/RimL family protein N-acetyltransferase